MTEKDTNKSYSIQESASIPIFGYELLRDVLLPSLLGKECSSILYWAGKDIARKYPLQSFDEISSFFEQAGWGTLTFTKESSRELTAEVTSPYIAERLKKQDNSSFQLEAGFLAQQCQEKFKAVAEAYEHPKKRAGKVVITIKWDNKDTIE